MTKGKSKMVSNILLYESHKSKTCSLYFLSRLYPKKLIYDTHFKINLWNLPPIKTQNIQHRKKSEEEEQYSSLYWVRHYVRHNSQVNPHIFTEKTEVTEGKCLAKYHYESEAEEKRKPLTPKHMYLPPPQNVSS